MSFLDEIRKERVDTIQGSIYLDKIINHNIIKSINNKYVKMYEIDDINYVLSDSEGKINILKQYMNMLNSFDQTIGISIIFNKKKNTDDFYIEKKVDNYDILRDALNENIKENVYNNGKSYIIKKYLCIDIQSFDEDEVIERFNIIDEVLIKSFYEIDGCMIKEVHDEWITKMLYYYYNPMEEDKYKKLKEIFKNENILKVGTSVNEAIAPYKINVLKKGICLNDKYVRMFYLKNINKKIKDTCINDILSENYVFAYSNDEISICIKIRQIELSKAVKMARKELGSVEGDIYTAQSKLGDRGVSIDLVPRNLKQRREEALYISDSLLKKDENLFDVSVYAMIRSDDKLKCDNSTYKFLKKAKGSGLTFVVANNMQEKVFNSILPYGVNQTPYTIVLDTESLCGFNIFNAIDVLEKEGDYYGINKLTNNPIRYNIMSGDNFSSLILGMAGKGKSFVAKLLLILRKIREEQREVIVIDPNGEWGEVIKKLGGKEINITAAGDNHINLFDIDSAYGNNPVANKEEFILSVCSLMLRKELTAGQRTTVSIAVREIYDKWIKVNSENNVPCLEDFAQVLKKIILENSEGLVNNKINNLLFNKNDNNKYISEEDIELLKAVLYYSETSHCTLFRGKSQVKIDNPIICFNLKDLGNDLKPLAMEVLCDSIWIRISKNRERRIPTDIIIDEFHLMFKNKMTANWMAMYWKMLRKFIGCPIGITQNPEDVLSSEDGRNVINNTNFSILLSLLERDRKLVKDIWKITDESIEYITDKKAGEGILIFGTGKNINKQIVVPFKNEYKKNNYIYRLINTSYDEE